MYLKHKSFSSIIILQIVFLILICDQVVYSQAPQGINYQGVALNNNLPIIKKQISLKLSLIENSQNGKVSYVETHTTITDTFGQFSVIIGAGTAITGKFTDVQWGNFLYFLKSEIDFDGGTNFKNLGVTQLYSVPYALYANASGISRNLSDSLLTELSSIKILQRGDSILLDKNRGFFVLPKFDSLRNAVGLFDYKMDKIKFVKDSGSNIFGGLGIGANALKNFDTAAVINSANIAIGYNAGSSLPKNSSPYHNNDNVFIGIASGSGVGLKDANGAGQNVMIGNYTGNYVNPQAYGNVVIGHEAGRFSFGTITGKNPAFNMNIAIGGRSLQYARVAENNISIGPDNLNRSTDVSRNISIGGFVASDFNGDDNVIIGSEMFRDVKSSGNRNIYIGSKISKEINGNGNIVLGYMAADDTLFKSISNKLIVSNTSSKTPLILGDFMTQSIEINGDLKVTGKFIQTSNSDTTIKFDRSENIFIDKVSLTKNKTGFGNIALGLNTLTALDSGSNNIAIGRNALSKMVVGGGGQGSESVAIGFNALMNSVGNGNTVLGKSAMQDATTASWNTAIGQHALQSNITGSSNVSIGYASMIQSSANASNNVVIGRGSGERLNSSNNVGIGYQSLWSTTSGADNISIGSLAGYSLTTGSNNIIIGSNTQLPAANTSNTILIGNNATLNSEIKGRLKTNGMALALVTVTGEYSAKISDEVILCDAETNPFTITLPNAVENSGQVLTIKKINSNSNSITINSLTSQKIDGSSTFLLSTQYAFIKVISNGANWFVIGN